MDLPNNETSDAQHNKEINKNNSVDIKDKVPLEDVNCKMVKEKEDKNPDLTTKEKEKDTAKIEAGDPLLGASDSTMNGKAGEYEVAKRPAPMKYLMAMQSLLVFAYFCVGISTSFTGASLPDLRMRTNSNWEEISRALVGRGAGLFIGAAGGGYVCDRFERHVYALLALAMTLEAIGTTAIPLCPWIWAMLVMFVVQGLCEGLLGAGSAKLIFHLWGKKASPSIYAAHLAFGGGAICGPQLLRPFLGTHVHASKRKNNTSEFEVGSYSGNISVPMVSSYLGNRTEISSGYTIVGFHNMTDGDVDLSTKMVPGDDSTIEYAYAVGGALSVVCTILLIFAQCATSKRPLDIHKEQKSTRGKDLRSILNPGTCAQGNTKFGFLMFIIMFFFFIHLVGGEWVLDKFIFAFVSEGRVHMEVDEATLLMSVYWGFFTGGRALGIVLSNWVKPLYTLSVQMIIHLTAGIVLSTEACSNKTVVWIMICLLGLITGPYFPGGMNWANVYLEMTGVAVSIVLMGSSCGGFIYQWVTGMVFQQYGLDSFTFVIVIDAACVIVTFLCLNLVARRQGSRFKKRPVVEEISEKTSLGQPEIEDELDCYMRVTQV
ncbi:sodium-dependent glucose transporter 1-like [Lingula anatina]|uniref:Sodium-dependent glucose transporter 1-like n=1 Tax=Lingula anatina TaxID=7574 RepID=A0A1S3JQI5_LINAN|nr:sodium-dependent glucose transporter 1-like [Lingula anatina]|eukprot:XP_013412615.1 sodium-dependent glucose transporter 1-like [Lingula anatina]